MKDARLEFDALLDAWNAIRDTVDRTGPMRSPTHPKATFLQTVVGVSDGSNRRHQIEVIFDEVTGLIVASSHGIEGYRMKDGFPELPPPILSGGILHFQPSELSRPPR